MAYSTGNNERDVYLQRAIKECVADQEPITLTSIAEKVPDDFAADQEELDGFLVDMGLAARPPVAAPQVVRPVLMIDKNPDGHSLVPLEPALQPEPIAEPPENSALQPERSAVPRLTREEASAAVLAAHNTLGSARITLRTAQQKTRDARGALAKASKTWQAGMPVCTPAITRRKARCARECNTARIAGRLVATVWALTTSIRVVER
jgi:hypothetical protein